MQIRTRLTLQFTIVVTLIIMFSFGIIYYASSVYRKKEFYQRLENKARTSADIFITVDQIDSTMQRIFDHTQKDKLPFEKVSIYNYQNTEVYSNNDTLSLNIPASLLNEIRKEGRKEFKQKGSEVLGITYSNELNRFVILASADDQFGIKKLENLRMTLIMLLFIIISIAAIAGWMFSGRALKPLSNVINEVKSLNVEKLDSRLSNSKYDDEIGRLIKTFNTLLQRVEEAFDLQKLFVSGASHELKNPLTTITSQLQVILINERSNEEYKAIIKSILDDIKSLNKTTLNLMEYARLNYEKEIQLSDVRLDDVLWFCKEYFDKTNEDYKVSIKFLNMPEDEKKLVIKGNDSLLKIAFINLIDNACKFSENKECDVHLLIDGDFLNLNFIDKGIGLTKEEINLIFEPFYRSNNTAEVKGHGFGLALAKKIIDLHNAAVIVKSNKGEGTTFSLCFVSKL